MIYAILTLFLGTTFAYSTPNPNNEIIWGDNWLNRKSATADPTHVTILPYESGSRSLDAVHDAYFPMKALYIPSKIQVVKGPIFVNRVGFITNQTIHTPENYIFDMYMPGGTKIVIEDIPSTEEEALSVAKTVGEWQEMSVDEKTNYVKDYAQQSECYSDECRKQKAQLPLLQDTEGSISIIIKW